MSGKPEAKPPVSASQPSLIPEKYLDVPSQRLYAISLALLIQAIKIFDFFQYLFSSYSGYTSNFGRKWVFVDLLFCLGLSQLRIPKLNYPIAVVILQILGLWTLDGLLFGGITLNLYEGHASPDASSARSVGLTGFLSVPLAMLGWDVLSNQDSHLQGQHTVRMSPISTAFLNPYGQTYCLSGSSSSVLIPILLNNSNPTAVHYSVYPLGYRESSGAKVITKTITSRELKAIDAARLADLQLAKASASKSEDSDDYHDDYDDEDEEVDTSTRLQKTQSLLHIPITHTGTIRLEDVKETSGVDARIVYPSTVTVAPCPRAEFRESDALFKGDNVRCAASEAASAAGDNIELQMVIYGIPPLSLKWFKEINGRQEYFMVEGIEAGHDTATAASPPAPQRVEIPLLVQARALGTHIYALDSVTDALGNTESLGSTPLLAVAAKNGTDTLTTEQNTKITRTLHVLRRPAVSFRTCSPARPAQLRINSETSLNVQLGGADTRDAPWDVEILYQPPSDQSAVGSTRRLRPWQQKFQAKGRQDLKIVADAPGQYKILDVKGKYCDGDILNPETCTVVEIPKPTAEIDWKRIHECSGDTGVEATLLLHGTPPFHVYYRMQRDKEPPRELVKVFQSARGEMTLQPPQSGHYVYTFSHVSDTNYQKVPLNGSSIEQTVHPLASAKFVSTGPGRQIVNSCSGDSVDVEVQLTARPWSLDVQLVGPKGSKTMNFAKLKNPRERLKIPVPNEIDRNGGTFEIDLVGVEDSSGCRRSISVLGITANIRRIKPTVKFYGKKGERHVTTLDHEPASLPLRLTGEGPWLIKYRNIQRPSSIESAKVTSANDHIQVRGEGTYEILEVYDSQCPGGVLADESTYDVFWVPRPSARLADDTTGTLERWNGSFLLPPVCEGSNGHVDLDLTGKWASIYPRRPPFQIMYNIARRENGGTRVVDQPTFNSIQARTRFQLHTTEPGRIFYEVKQVGDAAYPLAQHKNAVIPRANRPLFEQEVLKRPSARFRTTDRLAYCLHDAFVPIDKHSLEGMIALEGTPPFQLTFSIKGFAAGEIRTETVAVNSHSWKLDLPEYSFKTVGRHLITIESIQDASHCEQTAPDPHERSIWIDVAESAAIVPYDRREHFCVGEVAQFQLEGIPPWVIGYRINGKPYTQESSSSPFSIAQHHPGEFKITSIAHQQQRCKSSISDLSYTVHPLPSARVGQGKRIFQDIHEGDQAEIQFTLVGEPPFTFTYQRAEPSPKKGGRPGKVLETHTVSGVTSNEYSIFSALEGTWLFCRLLVLVVLTVPNSPM
ncbi:hypothetical protein K488DRAFT_40635 [Vararia minispora EC-137]|uniref:Uncharacterized protein n=1 Tax=Vararia minispora EC-137 TaxID=1314806 RepID=A0ACB8QYG6_9AGAM|nr:hypothetical protein K488DRAFT_40635 [Vararia minispora EC-137]